MTDFPYIMSRMVGTPLLIARPKLEVLLGVMTRKMAGETMQAVSPDKQPTSYTARITDDGIAVVSILGTLVRRSSYLGAASGLTSYHEIEAMAETAFADPRARAVLLEIDSSGGEAGGVFDLAVRLRQLSKETGKPLWAVADESALSAAYAIASAAEQIWVPQTAEIGSIGVVALHTDHCEADAKEGVSYTYIYAGQHKVDGNPHQPLSPEVHGRIQTDVDVLYGQFVGLVAQHRSLSEQQIRSTDADVFRGKSAVKAGLADHVGTLSQALEALGETVKEREMENEKAVKATPQKELVMEAQQEETQTPVIQETKSDQVQATADLKAQFEAKAEAKVRAQFGELSEIASQAARLGVSVDPAKALSQGLKPDAVRKSVMEQAAQRDVAEDIVAQTPRQEGPAVSPLVSAAKRKAKIA
jgi:signal peptide peptidase SppA